MGIIAEGLVAVFVNTPKCYVIARPGS
jgi:hypothetical protein